MLDVIKQDYIRTARSKGVKESLVIMKHALKKAGAAFDEAIIRHLRRRYGLLIGTTVAEEIKMSIGCVTPRPEALTMTVKGRDLKNGLAREATLASEELMEVLRRPARQIMDKVLDVLESTTPELVADIARNGIVLTGGGSQLFGMDRLLCERTEMTCVVADDADSCAAYGCGKSLSWMNHMQEIAFLMVANVIKIICLFLPVLFPGEYTSNISFTHSSRSQ